MSSVGKNFVYGCKMMVRSEKSTLYIVDIYAILINALLFSAPKQQTTIAANETDAADEQLY
jgi:hypothetical protein